MFTFTKRDDGLFAEHKENGRAVAHIDTRTVGETSDPNLRVQKRVETPLPREKWRIHFTAYKFNPAELQAFLTELPTSDER